MKIVDLQYDHKDNKYIIQFSDKKGITWFRELSTAHCYHSPKTFRKWLESLLEDVQLRS